MNTNQQSEKQQEVILGEEISSNDLFFTPPVEKTEKKEESVEIEAPEEKQEKPETPEVKAPVPVVEAKKEGVKEENRETIETPEVKKEEEDDDTDFNEVYKAFVATGQWKEVDMSEWSDKNIDKETFEQIAKEQTKRIKTEIREEVFSSFTQDEKDFIEYRKKGGNALEYLKAQEFKQRAEKIDVSTDQGKKSAIYSYYKNFVGWDDAKVTKHISRIETALELNEEAEMAKGKIEELSKVEFEKVKENARIQAEAREAAENKFKDDIKTSLKTKNYDTKKVNSVVRDFTDKDERNLTVIDRKYLELRNNPEKADELWSYLMDFENFKKKISTKEVNEKALESFKMIKFNKKAKNNEVAKEEKQLTTNDLFL